MSLDRDASNTDEYYLTALQIFNCCGGESAGTLRVDALMEKFAPFIKTNNAEYSFLKSLLDPDHCNPEISVNKLARALREYRECQKTKVDLDESFNSRVGLTPHDSDSGISTDGFQLLEELQCELREKAHLAHQLRTHLDYTDRHHEEAIATLTAERDACKTHLHVLREENASLQHIRRDYDETCDRLATTERSLSEAKREGDLHKKKVKVMEDQIQDLENEKLTLQALLTKSKAECHRINEMYASRQSALLEQNETLRTEHADLTAKLQDQDEYMQQLIKEKVLLEMELKDLLNKSNQTPFRLDHSIDVSLSEDQMLTALDTLNSDSRFGQDQSSVATQIDVPCVDCEKRNAVVPHRNLRKYFWEPLKVLFQAFAVICFVCAVSVLYGVTRRWNTRCERDTNTIPWRWFDAQDMLDLLLRIEYVADVPM